MKFNWHDYLVLAKVLATTPETAKIQEAALRSAVSRAYYAIYKLVSDHAYSEGFDPIDGHNHSNLPSYFSDSHEAKRKEIGAKLDRMRLNRNKADYDDRLDNSPLFLAEATVNWAQEVLNLLRSLP